jgi:hypothetical protein
MFERALYFVSSTENSNSIATVLSTKLTLEGKLYMNDTRDLSKKKYSLRSTYRKYLDILKKYNFDLDFKLQRTMAHIEAFTIMDVQQVDYIFESVLKGPTTIQFWIDWITIYLKLKDYSMMRKVYKKAITKYRDGMETIYSMWISFEEAFGDFETLNVALNSVFNARERDSLKKTEPMVQMDSLKRSIEESNIDQDIAPKQKKQTTEEINSKKPASIGHMKNYKVVESSNSGNMAYFGNLPYHTTFEHIHAIGTVYGRVIDLYLRPSEHGELEAYLEYQFADSVRKLVLAGPVTIGDTVVTPQRCRPAQSKWSFSNFEMKDTVYVSNLDQNCDKIILRDLFSQVIMFLLSMVR